NGVIGSNYLFTTVVTDFNSYVMVNQILRATNYFFVYVTDTNTAPFWINTIPDWTMDELTTTNIPISATDTDLPPNTLTYTLLNAPAGMTVVNSNGTYYINWTPSEVQGPGVYSNILAVVSDNVQPTPLTATNLPFTVTVNEVNTAPQWPTNLPPSTSCICRRHLR